MGWGAQLETGDGDEFRGGKRLRGRRGGSGSRKKPKGAGSPGRPGGSAGMDAAEGNEKWNKVEKKTVAIFDSQNTNSGTSCGASLVRKLRPYWSFRLRRCCEACAKE